MSEMLFKGMMNYVKELFNKNEKLLFLSLVVTLTGFGLSVLYEASYYQSLRIYKVNYYIVLKQAVYVALGFLFFALIQKINLKNFFRNPYIWFSAAAILPLLSNIYGHTIGGVSRWITFSLFGFDTIVLHTGFAAIIFFFCSVLILNSININRSFTKVEKAITIGVACWIAVMLLRQPDIIMFLLLVTICIYYLLLNGKIQTAVGLASILSLIIAYCFFLGPQYIRSRLISHFYLSDTYGSSFQVLYSRFSFFHGGWFGVSADNVFSSRLNLPSASNDLIFAVLGERYGLIGVAIYLFLLIAFYYISMRAIRKTKDVFEASIIKFLVYLVTFFSFLHIGVALHLLPIFGMSLPLFSYSGAMTVTILFTAGWVYKLLKCDGSGECATSGKVTAVNIKVFEFKKPLSLSVLIVAVLMFIRAVQISHVYLPAFNGFLENPNQVVNILLK